MQENGKKQKATKSAKTGATKPKVSDITTDALASPVSTEKTTVTRSRIVTKNEDIDTSVGTFGSTVDPSVIDRTVFENDNVADDEPITGYYHKSMTIDNTILSREQAIKQKRSQRKRRRPKTIDLTLAERYEPDCDMGLSSEIVEKRLEQGYDNYVKKNQGKSYLSIFVTNIFTFFNIMCFAVFIALLVVHASFSQMFFMVIITANIVIGIIQEIRSKYMIDKLSIVSAPTAVVVRDGERKAVPTHSVVLDDIVCYEMGKQIFADSVVVRGDCEVNESMLTGESEPVKKKVGDILYSGSFIISGSVVARVDKVGKYNYVETLTSHAKKYKKPKSELMNSIKLIIKVLAPFIIVLGALIVWTNYKAIIDNFSAEVTAAYTYNDWIENIWNPVVSRAAGNIIGMIPSGIFLLTSLALAASVIRLGKKQTLVQDLYCIEMLARVDVLCLDKTGTITDGSMQVNNVIEIKGFESKYPLEDIIGSILTATGDNNQTSVALANKFGYSKALNPVTVLPFSSQRKLSAVTFEGEGTYMLGAPEFVLRDMGVRIQRLINENAENGYRVLVLAHSPADITGEVGENGEKGVKLPAVRRPICLIVIEDHIREDAIKTIEWFKENNVTVKVISGDNPITVSEVAKRVGVENAELYISLDGMSERDVIEAADKYTVFGRVTPEQKRLLVRALKNKKHTVAMTGDGVNDILAMRESDCSISMASGSEAARNVSHLVLLDNDFTSMPDVVMEGRRVVNNVQMSSAMFLMKTFMFLIISVVFLCLNAAGLSAISPLSTNNMLPLEVWVIGIPSFFLALQGNKNIIRGKYLANVTVRALPGGIALAMGVMSVYALNRFLPMGDETVETMMVYVVTCIGLMVLMKQCEPFNIYRVVLFICTLIATGLFMYLLNSSIGITPLNFTQTCFTITVVLASYFIITVLTKIFGAIKIK